MVSEISVIIFIVALIILSAFFIWSKFTRKKRQLLNNLYLMLAVAYASWIIPLIVMHFVSMENQQLLYILDCAMQPGGALCAPLYLAIALTFISGQEKLPRWLKMSFFFPAATIFVSWTNPLHHLYYETFSVVKSEIVFGPYILVSGLCNYIFLIVAIVYMIRFAVMNKSNLYWKQCLLFIISGLCPLIINMYATFSGKDVPITATPLSFMVTLVLNGFAVTQLHMLDITPIATQHILNAISDSYIVLSEAGLVLKFNKNFEQLFAKEYGIVESQLLSDCFKPDDATHKTPIYNMVAAVNSSREANTRISYEQAVIQTQDDKTVKKYFVVEVSPLELNGQVSGFAVLFKDITSLRESMQRLQESQERMMEQERFAFLGQMIGGLAHNLKTPIMSIAGSIYEAEVLVDECISSMSDDDVTDDDYLEIYGEMREWFTRAKESTVYMSDIITAIKDQAKQISTDENITFTISEVLRRCTLLMRHELMNSGCQLTHVYDDTEEITLQGDVNNLVQVIGNLLSNAIYAQKQVAAGEIELEINHDDKQLYIKVKDRGPGISEKVASQLFKNMITTKGSMGSGLGLFISNTVIRGKFKGSMWGENREGGGSIFGIAIPLEVVQIRKNL
ncbi:MAG: GHKL domain-containing protein [Clostridia bacterium]|nr:GHKL domain-containing protein [Clostridia bacterium]